VKNPSRAGHAEATIGAAGSWISRIFEMEGLPCEESGQGWTRARPHAQCRKVGVCIFRCRCKPADLGLQYQLRIFFEIEGLAKNWQELHAR
jgi:hypothetical protein